MKSSKQNNNECKVVNESKRRFTKAALLASPILTTLPGKSALAGNCTSLSGMLSGNLSAPDGNFEPCDGNIEHIFGLSPGYWRTVCTNDHQFPFPYQTRDFLQFFSAEGETLQIPADLYDYTLLEALWLKNKHTPATQEVINLTRHVIAGVFSAATSNDYFISAKQLIQIYNSIISTGVYYEPVANEPLDLLQIVNIIESSYVGIGAVIINDNDTFVDCVGYKYDDRNGKGHLYIQDLSGGSYYRLLPDGSTVLWEDLGI